jgi:hypothetical protein
VDSESNEKRLGEQQTRDLRPTVGYTRGDRMHNETIGEKLGVANLVQDIDDTGGKDEPTWKGWRIINCISRG